MASDHADVSRPTGRPKPPSPSPSDMSTMRIAVAGTGGLACLIAHYIDEDTSHQVVFLSRAAQPQLIAANYQVSIVDYGSVESLTFALLGIDTVISTVTGRNQVELIRAAVAAKVRRFAPAEFEGLPHLRPPSDPLDRSRTTARQWLAYYASNIQSTSFICGILYERFQPGGLRQSRIGLTSGFSGEGDYVMDCRNMRAEVPVYDPENNPNVTVCLTAAQDVARFVTRAIDRPHWPPEMRMCGQRVAVKDLVEAVQRLKGQAFQPCRWHSLSSLRDQLRLATAQQNYGKVIQLHTLIATAEGRYDFTLHDPNQNLNQMFPDVQPINFQDWFAAQWNLQH